MPEFTFDPQKRLDLDRLAIRKEDLQKVLTHIPDIESKFRAKGELGGYLNQASLLISLIRDYLSGRYTRIPWNAICSVAATLLYVLNPLDIVPDLLFVLGLTDDAMIVAGCLFLLKKELDLYRAWKNRQ